MTDELARGKCRACEGGVEPLDPEQCMAYLARLHPGWTLGEDGRHIQRRFEFRNFEQTMSFVNAVAWIAGAEDHHPQMEVGYRQCTLRYTTHAIGGLSLNDFICAAKVDALLA